MFSSISAIPAKAETHASTIATAERWVPAFAGMAEMGLIDRKNLRIGAQANNSVIPAQAGIQGLQPHRLPWTPAFAGVTISTARPAASIHSGFTLAERHSGVIVGLA
jgi:hypothetical protein